MASLREWLDAAIPPPLPGPPAAVQGLHPHHHHHHPEGGQPDDPGGPPPPLPRIQVGGGDHGAFWRRQPAVAIDVDADAVDDAALAMGGAVMGIDGDEVVVAAPPAAEMDGMDVDFLPLQPPPPPPPEPPHDDSEGVSLVLPACNSFLRRALYESIEWEYPHLIVESEPPPTLVAGGGPPPLLVVVPPGGGGGGGDNNGFHNNNNNMLHPAAAHLNNNNNNNNNMNHVNLNVAQHPPPPPHHLCLRVWRLNAQERQRRKERLLREGWEHLITEKLGMYRVFLALTKACNGTLVGKDDEDEDNDDDNVNDTPQKEVKAAKKENATEQQQRQDDLEELALATDAQHATALLQELFDPQAFQQQRQGWTPDHRRHGSSQRTSTTIRRGPPGRPIPLVVHNGLHDLLFLLTHFHCHVLPTHWDDCKQVIHSYFPVIYDTKTMALEYCNRNGTVGDEDAVADLSFHNRGTHLGAVFERTVSNQPGWNRAFAYQQQEQHPPPPHPPLAIGVGGVNLAGGGGAPPIRPPPIPGLLIPPHPQDEAHEASYDAYMTGAAFCGLSYIIQEQTGVPGIRSSMMPWDLSFRIGLWARNDERYDKSIAWYYGRNKLHFAMSPYTIDLEQPSLSSTSTLSTSKGPLVITDPLSKGLSPSATFRVTCADPSVTTRDIVRGLSTLIDSQGDAVNFEVIWINDRSFMVAATVRCLVSPEIEQDDDDSDDLRRFANYHDHYAAEDAVRHLALVMESEAQLFQEHGQLIYRALIHRFPQARIESLQDIAENLSRQAIANNNLDSNAASEQSKGGNGQKRARTIWNLWGLIPSSLPASVGAWEGADGEGGNTTNKRQRTR
jgi:hypothetical protein